MPRSTHARAVLVVLLVFAVAACQDGGRSKADKTPRPRATPTMSPGRSAEPSPSPSASHGPIPLLRSLSYRGEGSGTEEPVRLPAGTYVADWSATAIGAVCLFRASVVPLDQDAVIHTLPEGQVPQGGTVWGSTELELTGGPYAVVVTAPLCKWTVTVDPILAPSAAPSVDPSSSPSAR
jgi:hypothetical protein